MTKLAAATTAVLVALSVATACRAQSPADAAEMDAMDSTDQHATHAAHEAMSGSMSMDPHMTLTPLRLRSGRFVPRLFGWMVHVMAFESNDPTVVWGSEHDHKPE